MTGRSRLAFEDREPRLKSRDPRTPLIFPRDLGHLFALVFLSAGGWHCVVPEVGSEVLLAELFQLPGVFLSLKTPLT